MEKEVHEVLVAVVDLLEDLDGKRALSWKAQVRIKELRERGAAVINKYETVEQFEDAVDAAMVGKRGMW